MHLLSSQTVNWWTGVVWIIVMFLSVSHSDGTHSLCKVFICVVLSDSRCVLSYQRHRHSISVHCGGWGGKHHLVLSGDPAAALRESACGALDVSARFGGEELLVVRVNMRRAKFYGNYTKSFSKPKMKLDSGETGQDIQPPHHEHQRTGQGSLQLQGPRVQEASGTMESVHQQLGLHAAPRFVHMLLWAGWEMNGAKTLPK